MSLSEPFTTIQEWLRQNGGFIHPSIQRVKNENGFGMFAAQPIGKDERLLQVPKSLCFTEDRWKEYDSLSSFPLEKNIEKVVAPFLVEWEQGKESLFHLWFGLLPSLEDFRAYHPYLSTSEEIQEMGEICPRVVEGIEKFNFSVLQFCEKTQHRFAKEDVQWAMLNYLTRAFDDVGLIPLCDLFNHSEMRGRGLIGEQELWTRGEILAGEEIFISYGAHHDTLEIWIQFGFWDRKASHCINASNMSFSPQNDLEKKIAKILQEQSFKVDFNEENDISKVFFHREAYLTSQGPSPSMLLLASLLGISNEYEMEVESNPLKSFQKLFQILETLRAGIREEALNHVSQFPKIQELQILLQSRLKLLKSSREWLHQECWKAVTQEG